MMRVQLFVLAVGAGLVAGCGGSPSEQAPADPAEDAAAYPDMMNEATGSAAEPAAPTEASPPDEPTDEYGAQK